MKKWIEYLMLTAGSVVVAMGLELILAPNSLVDGGVTALAIMSNATFALPIWVVFIALNLPALIISSNYMGKKFVVRTLYANIVTAVSLIWFAPFASITSSEVLILLYGGFFLGVGIGLVVKAGGAIDGTEMIAIWFNEKYHIPFTTFLFALNAVILSVAAFVFSLEQALFSIAIFFIVSKTVDFVLDGLNQEKAITIISDRPEDVGEKLMEALNMQLTYLHGEGGYSKDPKKIIYCVTNRFMYPKLKEVVLSVDKKALVEASLVAESTGIKHRKYSAF